MKADANQKTLLSVRVSGFIIDLSGGHDKTRGRSNLACSPNSEELFLRKVKQDLGLEGVCELGEEVAARSI